MGSDFMDGRRRSAAQRAGFRQGLRAGGKLAAAA
jgi:hypothetical protein